MDEDSFLDGSKDEVNVVGVGGTGQVGVDLETGAIEGEKLVANELGGGVEIVPTRVVLKIARQGIDAELLAEDVGLVEEEDNGRVEEPARVYNVVKELEGLEQAVLALLLGEALVVLAQGDTEDHRRDILKAMDPLLALAALARDIEHANVHGATLEINLVDPGGFAACLENVCCVGRVVGPPDPVDFIKEVCGRVDHVAEVDKFVIERANATLQPKKVYGLHEGTWELVDARPIKLACANVPCAPATLFRNLSREPHAQSVHGLQHLLHRLANIAKHVASVFGYFLRGKAAIVYDFHLLYDG